MKITRERLYEEVWAEPMTRVASRYGVASTYLARICKRLNVPCPARGYWAKRAAGKDPQRPDLPTGGPEVDRGWLYTERPGKLAGPAASLTEPHSERRFIVPARLTNPHPVLASTLRFLKTAKPQGGAFVPCWDHPGLKIHATRASRDRAARLVDTLLKAAEDRGYKVALAPGDKGGAAIVVGDQPVAVSVREEVDLIDHEPTKAELDRAKREPWHKIPKRRSRPSGRLTFEIDNGDGTIRRLSEGVRWKQEDRIGTVLSGVERAAESLKADRVRWEQWEKEREDRQLREQEAARTLSEEQSRVEMLASQVRRWRLARDIRALVGELRSAAPDAPTAAGDTEFAVYTAWAEAYADSIDPITRRRHRLRTGESLPIPVLPTE